MVAKSRSVRMPKQVGPRGPRGKIGPPGPPANGALKVLAEQVSQIAKELHLQLTRIAQIQAQLDRLSTGQTPERVERRSPYRIEH